MMGNYDSAEWFLDCVRHPVLKTRFEGWLCLFLQVWVMATPTLLGPMEQASLIP
jgi:hypothetical protein